MLRSPLCLPNQMTSFCTREEDASGIKTLLVAKFERVSGHLHSQPNPRP